MAASKNKQGAAAVADAATVSPNGDALDAAGRYVGQWNRLVSTTNWEKGRIICQWRDALIAAGAAVTDYSDEAWSQLVGGVTSQHVGRLRRVYQRFGELFDQFEGLYWSHFQAAIDWEDAEMWLEGAIHNSWSVSQMRGKRWETVGKPGETMPADESAAEEAAGEDAPWLGDEGDSTEAAEGITSESAEVKSVEGPAKRSKEESDDDEDGETSKRSSSSSDDDYEAPKSSLKSRNRLGVEVDELPEDIADAFEQFKLAIIAQRRLSWSETTPEAVLECLDALRELTLAPSDD
ncbi:MAG TPA: hypothetical protein VF175_18795 [Lacipirellula sp.]